MIWIRRAFDARAKASSRRGPEGAVDAFDPVRIGPPSHLSRPYALLGGVEQRRMRIAPGDLDSARRRCGLEGAGDRKTGPKKKEAEASPRVML
jgi:hypothetical protein